MVRSRVSSSPSPATVSNELGRALRLDPIGGEPLELLPGAFPAHKQGQEPLVVGALGRERGAPGEVGGAAGAAVLGREAGRQVGRRAYLDPPCAASSSE